MSYILDALKRADAERERDQAGVPGLHDQPRALDGDGDGETEPPPRRGVPVAWIAAGMSLVVLSGGMGWWWAGRTGSGATPTAALAPNTAPETSLASPLTPGGTAVSPPGALPQAQVPAMAQAPVPAPASTLLPSPFPAPAAPVPSDSPRGNRSTTTPGAAAEPTRGRTKALEAARLAASAEQAAPAVRIYKTGELPESIRRDLPKVNIGGAMYSDKAASRMLIINGQVFHEGDALEPDLTLRQIRLKEAVFEFRGYRYEVVY